MLHSTPTVGLTLDSIASTFILYGTEKGVYPADENGCRAIVSDDDETSAQTALNALDRKPCSDLGSRSFSPKGKKRIDEEKVILKQLI
ncbi:hypothetical protein Tco_0958502 [Tanacetum coccineum]